MNLTFIPLATLLLLLSGLGTPAHTAGGCGATVALMNRLLGRADQPFARSTYRDRLNAAHQDVSRVYASAIPADTAVAVPTFVLSRGLTTRRQYRTRFGFGESAHLAVGPPAMGFCADLG